MLVIANLAATCCGEMDAVQLRLTEQYQAPLRWDNLQSGPYHLGGVKPVRNQNYSVHTILLQPGCRTLLLVPPLSILRLESVQGTLSPADIEVWLENGSGLRVLQNPARTTDAKSLLVDPDEADPCIACIQCSAAAPCGQEIAVYVARREILAEIAPHRDPLQLNHETVLIRREDEARGLDFHCLDPKRPQKLVVEGPVRLALQNRVRYHAIESQRHQTWRIVAFIDNCPVKTMEFESATETRHRIFADDRIEVISQLETGYLEVPRGRHTLTFDTTASVYLRIVAQPNPDYTLPNFNEPPLSAAQALQGHRPFDRLASHWQLMPADFQSPAGFSCRDLTTIDLLALRSSRDNAFRDGGLQSYLLLRETYCQHKDMPAIRHLADAIQERHSFYRDLLPVSDIAAGTHRSGWFNPRRLLLPGKSPGELILNESHLHDAVDQLSSARFAGIGDSEATASIYQPPTVRSTTMLRVIVDRSTLQQAGDIFLQYGDRPPIHLHVTAQRPVGDCLFVPSNAEAALIAMRLRHRRLDAATLGGPFSQFRQPAAFVEAAFAEIILPRDVHRIRVWSPNGSPGQVALQIRASRPFRLSETQFLEMCRRCDCDVLSKGLSEKFPYQRPDESQLSLDEREIVNHLTDWYRQLASSAQRFSAGIVRNATANPPESVIALQTQDINAAPNLSSSPQAVAQVLSDTGHPFAALELWNESLASTRDPADRRRALFGRIDQLALLGEQFLCETQLRGLYLNDSDAEVRQEARNRLWQFYHDQRDPEALTAFLCECVISTQHPVSAQELARVFLERGLAEEALMTALMLPPEQRPVDVVLTSAYQQRWWHIFEAHLALVKDQHEIAVWRAYRELDSGAYDAAAISLRAGGNPGRALLAHLLPGRNIAEAMQSVDETVRTKAIQDLGEWHSRHPGPFVWREETACLEGSAGAAVVRALELDANMTCYRAAPQRPVLLSIEGPVKLKFELRPVHSKESPLELNDWIRIRAAMQMWPVPIIDNQTSEGLEITSSPDETAGVAIEQEIELGPGTHDLSIAAAAVDLLVRVFVQRPQIPLPVLPPLTRDIRHSVLTGTWGKMICSFRNVPDPPKLYLVRQECVNPEAFTEFFLPWRGRATYPGLAGRVLAHNGTTVLALPLDKPPVDDTTSLLSGQGDRQSVLRQSPDQSPEDVIQQMTRLLYLKESVPELSWECVVAGEELMQSRPGIRGLQPLYRRLTSQTEWIRSTDVQDSGGICRELASPNAPEAPRQRARAALLPPLTDGEYRIYGDEVLVMNLRNRSAMRVVISFQSEHPEYLPTAPVKMTWNIDDVSTASRELLPGQSETVEVPLAAGSHFLRIRMNDPFANQYLRIRLQERLEGDDREMLQPLVRVMEKDWFVATSEQALRFSVPGPAWIRIDELREGRVLSRFVAVREPLQDFSILPAHGTQTGKFRIFLRKASAENMDRSPLIATRHVIPAPEPLITCYRRMMDDRVSPAPACDPAPETSETAEVSSTVLPDRLTILDRSQLQPSVDVTDEYQLGGQEEGTWSLSSGYVNRRPLEQGLTGGKQDEFLQEMATYRCFDDLNDNYWTTDAFLRARIEGTPSMGLRNSVWHNAECLPVSVFSETSAYVQTPGQAIAPYQNQTEYSLNWRGEIQQQRIIDEQWSHTPAFAGYARYLSLTDSNYQAGRVDQDIFTPYKAQQRIGVILSDTLRCQPTLDTQLWLRGTVNTNEDFNIIQPDHVYARLGWRQLIGYVDFETTYRLTQFFSDGDRPQAVTQHLIDLDVVHDLWRSDRHVGESGLYVQHDIVRHATTLGISLTLYLDNGRGYRDIAPNDTRFRNRKRFREAEHANNQLWQPI